MRRLLAAVCSAAVFASVVPVAAATREDAPRLAIATTLPAGATATIDALVEAGIRAGDFPGAVVVIASSKRVLYRKAYGARTYEPRTIPNDASTIYEFASVTKAAITATAVMVLVQRGVLRTSDRVARWIPEFAANGKHNVTLAELLTHTAGMPPSFKESDYGTDRATILRHAYEAPLRFAPGSGNEYSNLAFIVLTEVITRASGKPYEQFARDELFAPLAMTDSAFDVTIDAAHRARLAPQLRGENEALLRKQFGTVPGVNGHAGLLATADDVAKLAVAYLRAARDLPAPGFPIAPQTVRAMTAPRYIGDGQVRALGWDLDSVFSRNRGEVLPRGGFGHTGSSGTSVWIDPGTDLAIVFASNAHYPDDKGASTVPLESAIASVVAARTRYDAHGADPVAAARVQDAEFSAEATRSALGFPAARGPAPTPRPPASPSPAPP
ncbi:MAG: serine-type D-Ala-D-Ala carboxypeptidase [Candidatus Eremiobacteraeota bacterium]|nr:serine-type D-Ala-D-Ala carboxypeptidase [Candidatus Eremiobacteraeota bacterium]